MATKANDLRRVDIALRSIAAILDELPRLDDDWEHLSRDEQLAWSLEWGNEMAKLGRLAEVEAAGQLDRRRAEAFQALAERTVGALGLVERLDLRQPSALVLAAGRVRTQGASAERPVGGGLV